MTDRGTVAAGIIVLAFLTGICAVAFALALELRVCVVRHPCSNCGNHLAMIGKRCTRCHRHFVAHGSEWQPQPPRVELYHKGRRVATVDGCDDIGCNDVHLAQMAQADRRKVPVEAIVPVVRGE